MSLLYVFVVGCSLALLFTVMFYALRNLDIPGSKAYVLQIVFVTIWAIGSLLEMYSNTEQQMLFGEISNRSVCFCFPLLAFTSQLIMQATTGSSASCPIF